MARVTVEDCLRQVNNRFALVHLATQRVRQYRQGAKPHLESKNKEVVVSLREVAAAEVGFESPPAIVRPARPVPGVPELPDLKGREED